MMANNQAQMANPEARANAPASFDCGIISKKNSVIGKFGTFAFGFVAGVTALAVTAIIVNDLESDNVNKLNIEPNTNSEDSFIDVTAYPARR